MLTTGQGWMMAFQAGGPHAQDRALEAVAYAWREQSFVPAETTWTKPQGKNPPGLSHQIFWFKMVRREWLPQPAFLRRPLMLEPLKWCFFAQLSKFRAAWRMVAMFCGA